MERSVNPVSKASGVTLVVGNEILLAKRCELWNGEPVPLAGYWSIFGGAIEKGESAMACSIREIKEETCVDIELSDLCYIRDIFNDHGDDRTTQFTVYFAKKKSKPVVVLNDEHTEFKWFDINDIENFPYKIMDDLKDCIIRYRSYLRDLKNKYGV